MAQNNNVIIWSGPVNADQLKDVIFSAPTKVVVVPRGICSNPNDKKCNSYQSFWALGESLKGTNCKFEQLIKLFSNKTSTCSGGCLCGSCLCGFSASCLCGFSAGYKLIENVLEDKSSLDQISAVLALDAYYFDKDTGYSGFYSAVKKAINNDMLMVMTTSGSPDAGFLTPEMSIKKLLSDFDIPEVSIDDIDYPKYYVNKQGNNTWMPNPILAHKKGSFVHISYGSTVSHSDHANVVGPGLIQLWISPFLNKYKKSSSGWGVAVGVCAGILGLIGLGWLLSKSKYGASST